MGKTGLGAMEKLRLPGMRPVDFVLFALLAALFILQLIQGYEISELQKEVRQIQTEDR